MWSVSVCNVHVCTLHSGCAIVCELLFFSPFSLVILAQTESYTKMHLQCALIYLVRMHS